MGITRELQGITRELLGNYWGITRDRTCVHSAEQLNHSPLEPRYLNWVAPFKGLLGTPMFPNHCSLNFLTFWGTSTQENLAPEASDRPETRLELLTRISSIRFVFHFLISRTSEHRKSHSDEAWFTSNFSSEFAPRRHRFATEATPRSADHQEHVFVLAEDTVVTRMPNDNGDTVVIHGIFGHVFRDRRSGSHPACRAQPRRPSPPYVS